MSAFFRLLQQKFSPPKDDVDSKAFDGKTVLITGATTGLGLEAAKKVVAKGAKMLIITARDAKRGQNAKSVLQVVANAATSSVQIDVLLLNMSSIEGVKAFVKEIETMYADLDIAILNAGTLQTKWKKVWRAHLTFVSSGMALMVKASDFTQFAGTEVLQVMSDEKAWAGGQKQYSRSKLLLEYAMRRIAQLPQIHSETGEVKVIVNSTCPGMCKSDLARQFKTNVFISMVAWILLTLFARTTEQGARIYISAVNRGANSQGQTWKDDRYYDGGEMIGTEHGEKLGDETWKGLVEVLHRVDPGVSAILTSK